MSQRDGFIRQIAAEIASQPSKGVLRVAIDGVDGAGKTVFADELAKALENCGRQIIRSSVDGFHNPREVRYRLGATSPLGFFQDSYNYDLLRSRLLQPLGPGGNGTFVRAAFDHRTNTELNSTAEQAEPNAILLLDGIFLHRPELRDQWDFSIFLEVGFEISIPRGAQRGEGSPDPLAESNRRYVEGQRIYLSQCNPTEFATLVINNEDLEKPYIIEGS